MERWLLMLFVGLMVFGMVGVVSGADGCNFQGDEQSHGRLRSSDRWLCWDGTSYCCHGLYCAFSHHYCDECIGDGVYEGMVIGPYVCGDEDWDSVCSPSNGICAAAEDIPCGETQSDAGSCGGSSCSVTGTQCNVGICSSGYCVSLGTPAWKDLNDNVIFNASLGDTVKMTVAGINSEDYDIEFELSVPDESFLNRILGWIGMGSSSEFIVEEVYTLINLSKHTFIAKISGIDIDDVTSGELTVLSEENDSKMTVEIVNPACGSVYNVTDDFNITVNADDADDVINGTLIINGVLIENFSNGETIFNYSFVYDGNHQIVVETVNNRGDIANDFVNVIAIDPAKSGDYVAACIDEPADASNVGTGAVYFNAASSKGIRYTASSSNIEIVDLPSSDLRLDWLFSNTLENPYHDGSHVNSYSFTANFVDAGNNWATLEVSLL